MGERRNWLFTLAATSGGVAVIAGAFAAHGARDPQTRELLRTGASYQAIHALAALLAVLAADRLGRVAAIAGWLFLGGTLLFSGSLYALARGAPMIAGAITPAGGLAFIAGWGLLAFAARRFPAKSLCKPRNHADPT